MRDIQNSRPQFLARMMSLGSGSRRVWLDDELGAIFRHQMSAPVQFDLGNLEPGLASRLSNLCASEGGLVKSFGDLFRHPHPPVELLELVKRFAKASRTHPESPLPHEIATVLYFLSIAAAQVRCGRRITDLDDQALRRGMMWAMEQEWTAGETRSLLKAAITQLEAQSG
jgi:hypothetical protein